MPSDAFLSGTLPSAESKLKWLLFTEHLCQTLRWVLLTSSEANLAQLNQYSAVSACFEAEAITCSYNEKQGRLTKASREKRVSRNQGGAGQSRSHVFLQSPAQPLTNSTTMGKSFHLQDGNQHSNDLSRVTLRLSKLAGM